MQYQMKSGVLYDPAGQQPLARIKGVFCGPEKEIQTTDGSNTLFYTGIRQTEAPDPCPDSLPYREYVMYSGQGTVYVIAHPDYAEGEDPASASWPLCRMPRVDHAVLSYGGNAYTLVMENEQNYVLLDATQAHIVQILHRGISGGWNIEAPDGFPAVFLCGLFVFCRYIEKENEFIVV